MKKLKIYEINEGLDGVIAAKSLKHAAKLLSPWYGYKPHELIASMNEIDKTGWHCGEFEVTRVKKVIKKGIFRKSKVLGWCPS